MDYLRYPPEILAEMARLRKQLEKFANNKRACPGCGFSFNHFEAAKMSAAEFDFGDPPAMQCPQCDCKVTPMMSPLGAGGGIYKWVIVEKGKRRRRGKK
jgi:hypothetical protein